MQPVAAVFGSGEDPRSQRKMEWVACHGAALVTALNQEAPFEAIASRPWSASRKVWHRRFSRWMWMLQTLFSRSFIKYALSKLRPRSFRRPEMITEIGLYSRDPARYCGHGGGGHTRRWRHREPCARCGGPR